MNRMMTKVIVILTPLLMTPLMAYLLSEGIIGFGGGEKDVLLLIPYIIWSVIYLIAGILFRKKSIRLMSLLAMGWSFGLVAVLWVGLLAYSIALS